MNRALLQWTRVRGPLKRMEMWTAQDGFVSYIITCDKGCGRYDSFYGRYQVSAKLIAGKTENLGLHESFNLASSAAEASR